MVVVHNSNFGLYYYRGDGGLRRGAGINDRARVEPILGAKNGTVNEIGPFNLSRQSLSRP